MIEIGKRFTVRRGNLKDRNVLAVWPSRGCHFNPLDMQVSMWENTARIAAGSVSGPKIKYQV